MGLILPARGLTKGERENYRRLAGSASGNNAVVGSSTLGYPPVSCKKRMGTKKITTSMILVNAAGSECRRFLHLT